MTAWLAMLAMSSPLGTDEVSDLLLPSLLLEQSYDTLQQHVTRDVAVTRLEVGLTARLPLRPDSRDTLSRHRIPRTEMSARYRLGLDLLDRTPEIGWHHQASALLRYRPDELSSLALGGDYIDTRNPLDVGGTLAAHSDRLRTVHAQLRPHVAHRLNPRMTLVAGYRFSWDDVGGYAIASHRGETGIAYQIDPRADIKVVLHYETYRFGQDSSELSVVAPVTWGMRLSEASNVALAVAPRMVRRGADWQLVAPDLRAALQWQTSRWRGAAALQRSLLALPGVAGLHEVHQATLALRYAVVKRGSVMLELGYLGVEGPAAHGAGGAVELAWRFGLWVEIYAGYRFGYQSFVTQPPALATRQATRHLSSLGVRIERSER